MASSLCFNPFVVLSSESKKLKLVHDAAGVLLVCENDDGKQYVFCVKQRKTNEETKQWDNTLSLPSGKIAPNPNKLDKKTGKPMMFISGTLSSTDEKYVQVLQQYEEESNDAKLTAGREFFEETGMVIDLSDAVPLYNNSFESFISSEEKKQALLDGKEKAPFLCVTYLVKVRGRQEMKRWLDGFRSSDETSSACWLNVSDLFDYLSQEKIDDVFQKNENLEIVEEWVEPMMTNMKMASYVFRTLYNNKKVILN